MKLTNTLVNEHRTAPTEYWIRLLREHIRKEDICLFPAANHRLTQRDQEQLLAAFEKTEAEEIGEGTHEACLKIADELAGRLGVSTAIGQPRHAPGCGSGH